LKGFDQAGKFWIPFLTEETDDCEGGENRKGPEERRNFVDQYPLEGKN